MARKLKKFYEKVGVVEAGGSYSIALDGKPAKTKAGNALAVPTLALAGRMAQEWEGEGGLVDFDALRLTRLASTAIDLAPKERGAWIEEVKSYLRADVLCYRAGAPHTLVARQNEQFAPFLIWSEGVLGARLAVTQGLAAIAQPDAAIEALDATLRAEDDFRLIGVRIAAQLTGSAVLALALSLRAFGPDAIFAASRLDDRFQAERWGADEEATERENRIEREFMAVAAWFEALHDDAAPKRG